MPYPQPTAPRDLDIVDVIRTSLRVVFSALGTLAPLALISVLPTTVISLILQTVMHSLQSATGVTSPNALAMLGVVVLGYVVLMFVGVVLGSISQAGMMHATVQVLSGRPVSLGDALRTAFARLGSVIGTSCLAGAAIALGSLLCLVPGIFAWVVLCLALPATVVERLGPGAAISRSQSLTEGQRLNIFLVFLAIGLGMFGIFLCTAIPGGIITGIQAARGDLASVGNPLSAGPLVMTVVNILPQTFMVALIATANAVIYVRLRASRDGVDSQALAQVFA